MTTSSVPSPTTADAEFPPLVAQSLAVSLTVKDVARSRDWYRDALGFTVDREHQREGKLLACSLRAGAIRLLVTQEDGSRGMDRVKGEGFSVQITTAQNIDAIAAQAKAAGVMFDTEPTEMNGVRFFRLRDLDGFKFVISAPRDW
jgi:catechol 2,3-dioxygenase-like lactoylglutathione lyase family enzyme